MNRFTKLLALLCLLPFSLTAMADNDYVELLTNGACDGTYSWVSSTNYCVLAQTIDLTEGDFDLEAIDKGGVQLRAYGDVISSYIEGEYGSEKASATVEIYNAKGVRIVTWCLFSDISAHEEWDKTGSSVRLASGARKMTFLIEGKGLAGKAGFYGPRFRNLSLQIHKDAIYSRADVNHDKDVNTTDVVAIYSYITNGYDSGFARGRADVNRDKDVNTTDVVGVYDVIINGEPPYIPTVPDDALLYPFSVSNAKTVLFAKGNLQYVDDNWQFASKQYEDFGTFQSDNHKDMFPYNSYTCPKGWYCLTNDEWEYLLTKRTVSNTLSDGALYTLATLGNAYKGMIVFPDEYTHPAGTGFTAGTYNAPSDFTATVSLDGWKLMEKAGAMFLPCSGYKSMGETWKGVHNEGCYMTTTPGGRGYYDPYFGSTFVSFTETSNVSTWSSVRLVR